MYISRVRNILQADYPLNASLRSHLKIIFGNGLAVFLFLVIFKPFGMVRMDDIRFMQIAVGFGAVCSAVLAFDLLLLPRSLPGLYNRKRWKVYHQAWRVTWQICAVAVANVGYAHLVGAEFSHLLRALWRSQLAAFTFALVPISVGVVAFRYRTAGRLSLERNGRPLSERVERENGATPLFLKDEQGYVKLQLNAADLLCLRAAQNYVEVVFSKNGRMQKELLRNSLKRLEAELRGHPTLVRCHRGYLVNLAHVVSNGGHGRTDRLVLTTGIELPVSRRRRAELRQRLGS